MEIMEDDQDYKLIRTVLETLKLEQYLEEFKAQAVTDDLVEEDVRRDQQCIKAIITTLGHQVKFVKELKTTLGIGTVSQSQTPESAAKGSTSEEFEKPETKALRASTSGRAKTLRQEYAQASQPKSLPRIVFSAIAEKLGLSVSSQRAVMKKVHDEAVNRFNASIEPELAEVEFFNDEELEELLVKAEDVASKFFEDVVENLDEQLKTKEMEMLDREIQGRKKYYSDLNGKKKEECKDKIKKTADEVLKKYFSLAKVVEEYGDGAVSTDVLEEEAFDAWATGAEKEFEEASGTSVLYDAVSFSNEVERSWDRLLQEVQVRNNQIEVKTNELTSKIIVDYQQMMEKVMKADEFSSKHEDAILKIKKTVSEADLDAVSKQVCLKIFGNKLNELRTSVHLEMASRVKLWNENVEKLTAEVIQAYVQATEPVLAKDTPVYGPTLEAKHNTCKKEVMKQLDLKLKSLEQQTRALDDATKASIIKKVEDDINARFERNAAMNLEKWEHLEAELETVADDLIAKYVELMDGVSTIAVDKRNFETEEKRLKDRLLKAFKDQMKAKKLDSEFVVRKEEEFINKLEIERQGCDLAFTGRLTEDKINVEAALFEAKKYYNEEMEKKFLLKSWYEPAELDQVHNEMLGLAIDLAKEEDIELTEPQEAQLREAFKSIYLKYQERNERQNPIKEPAIGIDLGTTYSCVGVFINNKVEIIGNFNAAQKSTVPSYVSFNDDGSIDIGDVAEENAHRNPQNTVFDAKRLIGRKFKDDEVQKDRKLWPFDVVEVHGEPRIKIKEKKYRPEEISAKILVKMKSIAQDYLQRPVTKAVVTVPAYFGDAQRKATKDAAYIAGLQATIINEPTAAAICYELNRTGDSERNILIFDLGGGTFDVVVLTMYRGEKEFTVKAIGGDTHIGGRDFDNNMMEALLTRVKKNHNKDLARNLDSADNKERLTALSRLRRLQTACEKQKRILSETAKTTITVDMLDGDYTLNEEFTREEFNLINEPLFRKCIEIVDKTIAEAHMRKAKIDDIVLVGGSTRIPKVQELLKNYFDGRKELSRRINPDEAVAHGAAFYAALLHGEQVPDEQQRLRYKDVTPFPLGVAVHPDDELEAVMSVLIPKNSQIPYTKNKSGYSTKNDFQTSCDIEIYEGSEYYVKANNLLGQFKLTGIPAAKAGKELMECTMTIDEEGILMVEARVITNGKKQNLKIETYNGRMTTEEKETAKGQDHFRWK